MRFSLVISACALSMVAAQPRASAEPELRAGLSELVYLTSFFGRLGTSLDVEGSMPLFHAFRGEVGLRLEIPSARPEVFVRFAVIPGRGRWRPSTALELGLTSRTNLGDSPGQLADARMQAEDDVSPVYAGVAARPLRFGVSPRLEISTLEIVLGTHLDHPGRWTRVQLGLVNLAARW